jgi:hypothetical protein
MLSSMLIAALITGETMSEVAAKSSVKPDYIFPSLGELADVL